MTMRLLIVSTLDSKEPFGAFTRPFYLGLYLSKQFDVCQLGLDCSAVHYGKAVSVGSRGLGAYLRALRQCVADFQPDIIYAQETLPGVAALLASKLGFAQRPALVFDFHTLSAFEYWTRLPAAPNRLQALKQLTKTYVAQGSLVLSGRPIIAAGTPVAEGIAAWYGVSHPRVHSVGNGVPEDLLTFAGADDPYQRLRPAKVAAVIAPKTFQFPSNDMSVDMTVAIAKRLAAHKETIQFVVIGRDADNLSEPLPDNLSFAGFLPSRRDFLAHLHHADVGLLPFPKAAVAGGARNKALDYLACQKLVISTPEGMRGLEAFEPGQHLLVSADSAEAMAETLLATCQNFEDYRPLAETAFQLVKREYSWQAMAEKVAVILKTAADRSV
ncbi:MAG: glycosyltransferase family 4 protein [Leptolyngbya sp. SIO4C1]|nr:glycosyltransferase family 4 protein [Leptolyngbya sp. SIO4C1]